MAVRRRQTSGAQAPPAPAAVPASKRFRRPDLGVLNVANSSRLRPGVSGPAQSPRGMGVGASFGVGAVDQPGPFGSVNPGRRKFGAVQIEGENKAGRSRSAPSRARVSLEAPSRGTNASPLMGGFQPKNRRRLPESPVKTGSGGSSLRQRLSNARQPLRGIAARPGKLGRALGYGMVATGVSSAAGKGINALRKISESKPITELPAAYLGGRAVGRRTGAGYSALGEVRGGRNAGVKAALGYGVSLAQRKLAGQHNLSKAEMKSQMMKSSAFKNLSEGDRNKAAAAFDQWYGSQYKLNREPSRSKAKPQRGMFDQSGYML